MSDLARISAFILMLFTGAAQGAGVRDGRMYDPGIDLRQPSALAPEQTARLLGFLGDWNVESTIYQPNAEPLHATGQARVTFMNRGNAFMERVRIADFDGQGHAMAMLSFIAVTADGTWSWSEGNSWGESIRVYSGALVEDALVAHSSSRPGGGNTHLMLRRTFTPSGEDAFTLTTESSADVGATWNTTATRRYTRAERITDFFPVRDDTGAAAEGLPGAAHEFDFLLGEFDASHWLPRDGGTRWQGAATATRVLDGHAILEVGWQDSDPERTDAATSILRIYNRATRQWESLFMNNRQNTPLHFGGVREENRIVLHLFDVPTAANSLYQWIFFDVRPDAYRWKGLQSSDRGEHWSPHWLIEFQRKGVPAPDYVNRAPDEVSAVTADGVRIYGDHYRSGKVASPTVLLFHQAGGDARGEYGDTARRLVREGYEVFAWDARSGGERFGEVNRTVAGLGAAADGYCAAYPDLEAALKHAFIYGSGGPIFAVGSSYSAALVIRLAAEHGNRLAGVAAFSPASSRMEDCEVADWLPRVAGTPVVAFRPVSEMEVESVKAQRDLFGQHGIELVTGDGAHGASMLNPGRSDGDVEATWRRLLGFIADPTGSRP
jgi:dienelactone hydrolase